MGVARGYVSVRVCTRVHAKSSVERDRKRAFEKFFSKGGLNRGSVTAVGSITSLLRSLRAHDFALALIFKPSPSPTRVNVRWPILEIQVTFVERNGN